MSDDNHSKPLGDESLDDFDFDAFNMDSESTNAEDGNAEDGVFDFDNPFGEDALETNNETSGMDEGESAFDFGDSLGENIPAPEESLTEESLTTDNPENTKKKSTENENIEEPKKKGLLGGLFGGKGKTKKEKKSTKSALGEEDSAESASDTEGVKVKKPKKEKVKKEKVTAGERAPLDWGALLCIIFSVFLLASLVTFNIAAVLTRGSDSTILQTLCFIGAINIIGLAAASVPVLFYRFPKERTLPNVLLGISVVALFTGVLMALYEFYNYGFALG